MTRSIHRMITSRRCRYRGFHFTIARPRTTIIRRPKVHAYPLDDLQFLHETPGLAYDLSAENQFNAIKLGSSRLLCWYPKIESAPASAEMW